MSRLLRQPQASAKPSRRDSTPGGSDEAALVPYRHVPSRCSVNGGRGSGPGVDIPPVARSVFHQCNLRYPRCTRRRRSTRPSTCSRSSLTYSAPCPSSARYMPWAWSCRC
jgi:hypothetical protein